MCIWSTKVHWGIAMCSCLWGFVELLTNLQSMYIVSVNSTFFGGRVVCLLSDIDDLEPTVDCPFVSQRFWIMSSTWWRLKSCVTLSTPMLRASFSPSRWRWSSSHCSMASSTTSTGSSTRVRCGVLRSAGRGWPGVGGVWFVTCPISICTPRENEL